MQIAQPAVDPTAARTLSMPSEDQLLAALVDRVTNGLCPEEFQLARQLGFEGYVEYHLTPNLIDDSALDAKLVGLGSLNLSAGQLLAAYGELGIVPLLELRQAAVLRAAFSKRQLFERVVELFSDHFNVYHQAGLCTLLKTVDDREVIRAHALGRFPELLVASARSAAMSVYLDNYANTVLGAQENYARELMELHTLGVDGGYTEDDVKNVARAFTGWTFDTTPGPGFGDFKFTWLLHDQGEKTVLGVDLPEFGGLSDGSQVLAILAGHDSTARNVAGKLCRWFLGYDVPPAIVERVAEVYHSSGGDLREMVRATLRPEHFLRVKPWEQPKLKRPLHFAASLLRAAGIEVQSTYLMTEGLRRMGQVPYDWSPPNGYPDSLGAWGSSLLPRWEFASNLLAGVYLGCSFDPDAFLVAIGNPPKSQLASAIDERLTGGRSPSSEVALVQRYVDDFTLLTGFLVREAVALAASMPHFQLY
ncbi:DUF1800 domain-containing protein [Engelhardtia mirabilis]|uniref:DUF1800 domain-containing protein n=1 Tax=Engelhardtia mirabilis TaxID=2528011 RepID=A0A518BS68_9BACT|nr:hypothetical protein Pla133_49390 [Planctomycetes bacterium Pla133]QDV04143.1 hypothetical protein Pla86_49370 [Planctomycetes bacterium Pla86]